MAAYPASISLSGLNGRNGFRLDGLAPFDWSGTSVASAGDVNGDGRADLVIGASGAGSAGEAYVVFGKSSGWSASLDLSALNGRNGFKLEGALNGHSNGKLGASVAAAGDVDGDGYDDLLVGGPDQEVTSDDDDDSGAAYLVLGKASGWSGTVNLRNVNGSDGVRFWGGNGVNTHLGRAVSSAGDLNGDGYDDMVVAAPSAYGLDYAAGRSYVVFGHAGRWGDEPNGGSSYFSLGTLDGKTGFTLLGEDGYDYSGSALAAAGDVNGDGFDDLIVGASDADPPGEDMLRAGSAYVLFGKASGWSPTASLSLFSGKNGFIIDGRAAGDNMGADVSGAGDVNGDGFDDVIVASARGAYVLFGKASGWTPLFDVAALDGRNGFRIASAGAVGSVAAAGDFNGDGFGDVVLASGASSFVVFGKASGWTASLSLASLSGGNGIRIGGAASSVAGTGDVNGDGLSDLVIGNSSASPGGKETAGASYVVFGRLPSGSVTRTGSGIGQSIHGGNGNDTLIGRGGADTLYGEGGSDTASYAGSYKGVTADLAAPAGNSNDAKGDRYKAIENLSGTSHGDRLSGNSLANVLSGAAGDDLLKGRAGNDKLHGGAGGDALYGGDGRKGMGSDTFVFTSLGDSTASSKGRDTIYDFASGDRFDLQGIDASTKSSGNQSFTFIETQKFHGRAGELRYEKAASDTYVYADVNGDKKADFGFHLDDAVKLVKGDFLV
jgi:hypothetical protein